MSTKHLCVLIHVRIRVRLVLFKHSLFSYQGGASLWILLLFVFAILSCLFLVALMTPVGKGDVLALLYVMFSCVFVTFPYAVLSQVWCVIVLFLIFGFFLALSYKKLFERKSKLVRGEQILVKGHLLTTNGLKIKE